MAVIINELEVVLESPGTPTGPASAAPRPAQPVQQIQPYDVTDLLDRELRAKWRLLAH